MSLKFAVNNSLSAITALPDSISGGALNLISTSTASGVSAVNITSGIDSTYKEYIFKLINIHGSEDQQFKINFSIDGGSNFNVSKTATYWGYLHQEDDAYGLSYNNASADIGNSTSAFNISRGVSTNNDDNSCGTIHLFDQSSTTFVKHFLVQFNEQNNTPGINQTLPAGYANTTSAINAMRFECSAGTFDGIIKMYGVS